MLNELSYWLSSSYRRKLIDVLLKKNQSLFSGVVLDIGGRDRGKFQKPKKMVAKWIFADIETTHHPDVILDVARMEGIEDASIDTINAMELFEHVEKIEDGIAECSRVLKPAGLFIVSMPFLYPIHADPFDFQRWTAEKWKKELQKNNFTVEKIDSMGGFFTVMGDMLKFLNKSMPKIISYAGYIFYPVLDMFVRLDSFDWIKKNKRLRAYTTGYFIVARKK